MKELCRKHGFSDASFYLWRSEYSGVAERLVGRVCGHDRGAYWDFKSHQELLDASKLRTVLAWMPSSQAFRKVMTRNSDREVSAYQRASGSGWQLRVRCWAIPS